MTYVKGVLSIKEINIPISILLLAIVDVNVFCRLIKINLKFIGPKVCSSIPDDIIISTTFTFKWKLKKHFLHEKIPI